MSYLVRRGFVSIDGDSYLLTYEGKELFDRGGLEKERERKDAADFNLKVRNWILTVGSLVAGMYSLWKLFAHFDKILTVDFLTFFFVFFAGAMSGVIIYMLLVGAF